MKKLLLTVGLLLIVVAASTAQPKSRTIDQGKQQYENQPVKIVGCETDKGTFLNCNQIVGVRDWWKGLSVMVKNVSTKTISEFVIELAVEKQLSLRTQLPVVLVPEDPFEQVLGTDGNLTEFYRRRVQPGEVFRLSIADVEFRQKSEYLERIGLSDIDHLLVNIQFIYFDDGTSWSFGRFDQIPAGQSSDITKKRITENFAGTGPGPVKIIGIQANGKAVNLNETFIDDSDWLRELTIKFENQSGQGITGVTFFLVILESKPTGPPPVWSLVYGNPSKVRKEKKEKIVSLPTGETGLFKMDAAQFESIKKILASSEDLVHRMIAEIKITDVTFADGTFWSWGKYYKWNPDRPTEIMLDAERTGKLPN